MQALTPKLTFREKVEDDSMICPPAVEYRLPPGQKSRRIGELAGNYNTGLAQGIDCDLVANRAQAAGCFSRSSEGPSWNSSQQSPIPEIAPLAAYRVACTKNVQWASSLCWLPSVGSHGAACHLAALCPVSSLCRARAFQPLLRRTSREMASHKPKTNSRAYWLL